MEFSLLRNAVLRTLPVALADYVKAARSESDFTCAWRLDTARRVFESLSPAQRLEFVNLMECNTL